LKFKLIPFLDVNQNIAYTSSSGDVLTVVTQGISWDLESFTMDVSAILYYPSRLGDNINCDSPFCTLSGKDAGGNTGILPRNTSCKIPILRYSATSRSPTSAIGLALLFSVALMHYIAVKIMFIQILLAIAEEHKGDQNTPWYKRSLFHTHYTCI